MVRIRTWLAGGVAAAALPWGCSLAGSPQGRAAVRAEAEDVEALRAEVQLLEAALLHAREALARAPSPERLEALERRLRELDDGAWDEAVALGIARRFEEARTGLTPEAERRAAAAVVREARAVGLDPLLVAAVIEVESTFRAYAVSRAGAVGLMQVMPRTARWIGERIGDPIRRSEQLFDPERNIRIGVRYLAELQERFGRLDLALLAYNAGPTRARRIAAGPEETLERWLDAYARKVLAAHGRMQAQLAGAAAGRS